MFSDADNLRRCYELLELEPGASRADVEQAYRDLAKVWHPDRFRNDHRLLARAEEKMKEINEARRQILAHPAASSSRAARGPRRPAPPPAEAAPGSSLGQVLSSYARWALLCLPLVVLWLVAARTPAGMLLGLAAILIIAIVVSKSLTRGKLG